MSDINANNVQKAKVHYKKIDKVDDMITKMHGMLVTNKDYSIDLDELLSIVKKVEDLQDYVQDYMMNLDMEIDEYEEDTKRD